MASRSLGQLTLDLVAKVGGFTGPIDKAARHAKKRTEEMAKSAAKIGTALAAGFSVGAAALTAATLKMVGDLSRLQDAANASAVGVETFQAWAFAAEQAGVSVEQFESAMRRANQTIGQAVQGSDRARKVFADLGVAVLDANGNVRSTESVVRDYAEAVSRLGSASQQAAASASLFGREAGARMAPLLANGAAGLLDMEQKARDLGVVLDANLVAAAEQFGDEMDALKRVFDAGLARSLGQLIPVFSDIARAALGAVSGLAEFGRFVRWAAEESAAWVGGIAATDLPRLIGKMQEAGAEVARLQKLAERPGRGSTIATQLKEARAELDQWVQAVKRARELQAGAQGLTLDGAPTGVADVSAGAVLLPKGDVEAVAKNREKVLAELDETARLVAETIERAEKSRADAQQRTNMEAQGIRDSLRTEEEAILESYERRRAIVLENTLYTGEAQTELLRRLEEQRDEQLTELNAGFWERYLAAAEENLTSLDQITADLLTNVSTRFGDAFESMIFDAESLGDAMRGMAEDMLRAVVNAIGQMIAQWLAMQAVQMLIGRTSEAAAIAGAAATGSAVAAAYAPAAAMASLASFGANAAPAIAGIATTTATAQTLALTGMAHDGIDRVPKTGTWLLEKGERVMTSDTSARLDSMLSRVAGGGAPVVNIQNAPPGNHQVGVRRGADGQQIIDVLLADIQSDGPAARAISGSYGLRRRGR